MSTNAYRFSTSETVRNQAILAEQANLACEYLAGRRDWRADLAPARDPNPRPSFDRKGLEALISAACADFRLLAGFDLPYNLYVHGPWVNFAHGHAIRENPEPKGHLSDGRPYWGASSCEPGTVARLVESAAKTAAFIRAAADSPFLRRVLKAGTSQRGVNSPATSIDVYRLAERYSPKAAIRTGCSIRRRADEILQPHGLKASWKGVAIALTSGPKGRVGKSAVIAAAITLGFDGNPGYKRAREYLITVCRTVNSRQDATDGVLAHTVGETTTRHGVSATPVVYGNIRRKAGYLITGPGGRTYHTDRGWSWPQDAAREAAWAMRQAREAWAKQRKAEREASAESAALSRVTVLVTWEDSYRAGNCRPGTREFATSRGWQNRAWVPAAWLRSSGNNAAIRAAKYAEAEVLRLMAA